MLALGALEYIGWVMVWGWVLAPVLFTSGVVAPNNFRGTVS
jgi:hypothetical protein